MPSLYTKQTALNIINTASRHGKPSVREALALAEETNDQETLKKLYLSSSEWTVKSKCVLKLTDKKFLEEIVCRGDDDHFVLGFTISKIENIELLMQLAVRSIQTGWYYIVTVCAERLIELKAEDELNKLLEHLRNAHDPYVQVPSIIELILTKVKNVDIEYLVKLAVTAKYHETKNIAIRRLKESRRNHA